ncbi:MAG: cytochrome c [Planctomycetota bacterium]|nr:cytochrome c [Planctomycetota bacterium]
MVALAPPMEAFAADRTGEQIYKQQCASCHGGTGEGTVDYPRALAGDRSVAQLSGLIAKTMPEDDPGSCVGDDANKVAAYIYESFYSSAARARNKPPRIELSRLTVRQYRNAVADLIGGFQESGGWDERRGVRGQYYKARQYRDGDRVFDRVDPEVRFDFGVTGPDPEKFQPNEFSIRWEGSVLAPETGEYEFIVRTENAASLWINDNRKPLIDALVKSGTDTEYRASIVLLGGRAYPLRLEFTKAKQGVDDSKNRKGKPPEVKASIALEWKLPHRPAETIPGHCLSPRMVPESFVVTTAFPPDDRSVGYERGTSVSKAWDQATTSAAIEVAGYVTSHLRQLANAQEKDSDREKKLREFCLRFVERAFRRPLSDDQKQRYIDRQFSDSKDLEIAVKRVVLLALKSPRFLYREVDGNADAYDVAARISFGLWDSLPDQALLNAAASGQLATREQVVRQAERMVTDLRTHAKVRAFFLHWLRVEQVPDLSKDAERFPGFDETIASDLRTSLDLFLEDVVWSEASDFRKLLLSDFLFLNGRLAKYYDVELLPDAPFQRVTLYPGERAGVLTHPYLMAAFAYTSTTSPIHRGVFISRSVLGRSLRPPPEAVAPLAPDLHAGLSTRDRVTLQTSPAACMTCHGRLNPLGFGLEHFDAVGRFREDEKGKPIDSTGIYETLSGGSVPFSGARELAGLLAASEETHTAFVEELFHTVVKQPIRAFGPRALSDLRRSFAANGFNIRKLIVEMIASTALPAREWKP